MGFNRVVKDQALASCGRCCCICHKFCGTKIECHHIVQEADGGDDSFENCIPVCFDCHADIGHYDNRHPKGTKYSDIELKNHRDAWFAKVANGPPPSYGKHQAVLDRKLAKRLLSSGVTSNQLLEWNFGFKFPSEEFYALTALDRELSDPFAEFIDPDLEALRAGLAEALKDVLEVISLNTAPSRAEGFGEVYPTEWENPAKFMELVLEIHACMTSFRSALVEIVRQLRRKLGVDPHALLASTK